MKIIKCTCEQDILVDDDSYVDLAHRKLLCDDGRVVIMYHEGQDIKKMSIAEYLLGTRFGFVHDHIDRNIHNNQKFNLRFATRTQNSMNRGAGKGTSKYKGVSRHSKNPVWVATININRKKVYLGSFQKEEDAAKEYDRTALTTYREFAYLNFPIPCQNTLSPTKPSSESPAPNQLALLPTPLTPSTGQ